MARGLRRWVAVFVLSTAPVALPGCVAVLVAGGAAAGAGAAVWYQGKLTTALGASLAQTRQATAEALKSAGNGVIEDLGGSESAELKTDLPSGKTVTVSLKAKSSSVTEVVIRVGFWGDQERSQWILDDIRKRLPSGT